MTPEQFVAKWRSVTLKERSAAQEHFIDLCRMLGEPTPTAHPHRVIAAAVSDGADRPIDRERRTTGFTLFTAILLYGIDLGCLPSLAAPPASPPSSAPAI